MSKLRKAAKGRYCMVRIPGVCNSDPDTVVLAHLSGGGMGAKRHDIHGAWCCSSCHDAIDGRTRAKDIFGNDWKQSELKHMHIEGVLRTQEALLDEGLIKV
jgi:hypothetical protein